MGTGVTPKRIATKNSLLSYLAYCPLMCYTSSVFLRISRALRPLALRPLALRLDGVNRSMHPRPFTLVSASTPAFQYFVCADAP